ncbi:MAG TPA: hypothetical protein PKD59_09765 [Miltoncostaeaceae bacterium]|nr:hypothetical protein [Miltoncostaeaceae bacterium]
MRSGWWIGVTAGVALGIGTVAAVDVATQPATAATGTVTFAQFKQVQKVSIAAVKRTNADHKKLNRVAAQLPLWAVSSGAPGSNLLRGDGVVLSQRLTDGNYRVRFVRDVSQCTWSGTPATDGASLPDAFSVRIALDITEPTKSQLIVRTNDAAGNPKDSGFHVQVFC